MRDDLPTFGRPTIASEKMFALEPFESLCLLSGSCGLSTSIRRQAMRELVLDNFYDGSNSHDRAPALAVTTDLKSEPRKFSGEIFVLRMVDLCLRQG